MMQIPTQQKQVTAEACASVQALEHEFAFLVRRLEAVRLKFDFGLERAHYLLLLLLEERNEQSIGCLAERVNLDASTVTRQIAAMQRCGLVEKHPNPADRRGGFLSITDKGRSAVTHVRQQRLQHVGRCFRHWEDAERFEFARLLARFSGDLSELLQE